ncbi:hypothetical protein [Aggregatilinea lenta]|uniref:hypothetical protein n=1 Tax=Aggregatilinea lenta TaxID=913108 RepID=UPI0013C35FDA|nr:hypothetical protein [Aggregatilinea lenta]
MQRVGLYAWGGPGTIRLLQVKYHAPRIDAASFMALYDDAALAEAKDKLGVTDMWVTFSWGFSTATEQPDRRFIVERLPNFAQYDIAPHAYVQGLNLVTDEFADQDVFCCDPHGRLLPYSKGRSFTCPNKPAARAVIRQRVEAACAHPFAGVFIDNLMFGLPPFMVRRDYTSFFGCACEHCQAAFRQQYGYALPTGPRRSPQQIADTLDFRARTLTDLCAEMSCITRDAGKTFGVNLYDPYWHAPEFHFGYSLAQLGPHLDYYLIENHALAASNRHLIPLIAADDKPVFVVSYRDGIGHDAAYTQAEIDAIWCEAAALGYFPALKATEYITDGTWHALDLSGIHAPNRSGCAERTDISASEPVRPSRWIERRLADAGSAIYAPTLRASLENTILAHVVSRLKLDTRVMRAGRRYTHGA